MPFDNDVNTPSTDLDLKNATHNRIQIIDYDQLARYNDIDELLPNPKSAFILLYEHAPNKGHWTTVGRDVNNDYYFFCSYGSDMDEPLNWVNLQTRNKVGAGQKYLSKIFNGRPVLYNSTVFQDENTNEAVCGEFAAYVVNETLKGVPFENILQNLENIKEPRHKTYAESIVDYWSDM